ncbi:MAG: hypothetical protein ACI9NC_005008 [Verrucomicrobiales bacterium]
MTEICKRLPDPRISSGTVFLCHLDYDLPDLLGSWRATYSPSDAARIVFLRDELAVPREQGLRRDKVHNLNFSSFSCNQVSGHYGISFSFAPYHVGCYAAGAYHVDIRWDEIAGIIDSGRWAFLGRFSKPNLVGSVR